MGKVNILLVDDQPAKLLAYQAILSGLDENLVTAGSGREALQQLLKNEFALVLLDVVMPEMDGFETATLIRQRPRSELTPIIFVTAYSTSELDKMRGYELGAVDYVFSPIVPEILRAKVAVFVELFRNRRKLARANQDLQAEVGKRKEAQEQALQAERLAAIGQMVAGLAHESRNSLQVIQASAEMLARRVTSSSESALIQGILRAQDRLHHLLEDVRGYAAPLKLSLVACNLTQLWREAWGQLALLHEARDVALVENADGVTLNCLVDSYRIERLFRNILENSLTACKDPVRITITCSETRFAGHSAVRVVIADNGPGLNAEQRERIFDPFYTTKTNGSGLGMAIVTRIAEAHQGQIRVADIPSPGTAIELLLPRGSS
jgi:signal transduction histidine kinase